MLIILIINPQLRVNQHRLSAYACNSSSWQLDAWKVRGMSVRLAWVTVRRKIHSQERSMKSQFTYVLCTVFPLSMFCPELFKRLLYPPCLLCLSSPYLPCCNKIVLMVRSQYVLLFPSFLILKKSTEIASFKKETLISYLLIPLSLVQIVPLLL